ncbi:AMP-dependent synthetase/ligase [Amycolatopsis taiwanensis]|uniref:AMP-dependent synthetase/ligase n=1 Tax=Amycolatopsis taiwanensis TaxID=342230 RepID=UPI00048914C1|nr:long-chain fatty acid--CoA ligase [Amycolatopsis taiwanensis]
MSNAADDIFQLAGTDPERALFARKSADGWQTVSAKEFAEEVVAVARGLVSAGIRAGDRVALMSATRYEWVLIDYAIWTIGAVSVPVYETDSAEQVAWILADSGAIAAFAENAGMAALVEPVAGPVWSIEDGGLDQLAAQGRALPGEGVRGLAPRRGLGVSPPENTDVESRRAAEDSALATIVYTSGTTGRPKGCMLTHGNLVSEVDSIMRADGIGDTVLSPSSAVLLFLPLAHILARIVQLAVVRAGALTAHTGRLTDLEDELTSFRPTLIVAVPRVFEKLLHAAARRAETAGRAWLFELAERVAITYSEKGRGRLAHRVFDRFVYRGLRDALGGRIAYAVCGGAPLSARLSHFLRGAGVPVLAGYGLTETCGPITLNPPFGPRLGTAGRPLPHWSVRIAPDGEVLVSGPGVFAGYWHDEPATRAAFDGKGWLRTGDLGELHEGYLTITGRKKDVIVTAGGKNVAPEQFEDRLNTHWLIENSVVVGDRRPYVGALITLDTEAFDEWKRRHGKPSGAGVEQLRDDPELAVTLEHVIDEVNWAVSRAEAIRRFRVLPGRFTVNDELTPTRQVRRQYVLTKYADEVDELYLPRPREGE